jgi:hypothetical protein
MIKISAKGLAKFMTSSSAAQRKVLRDFKFPDDEGTAQAAYYRDAREVVSEYHRSGHDRQWLRDSADALSGAAAVLGGRAATRLRHNARGLREYANNFTAKQMEVLPRRRFAVAIEDVRISVVPDLHVREKDRERLIKLEFAAPVPHPDVIKIITQLMFEAALQAQLPVRASDVLYLDVSRGESYKGARMASRVRTDITAACTNIAALWPTI